MSGNLPHRRRREKKTNYKSRFSLLKSGKCRLVVRRQNNNIKLQAVEWEESGDRIVVQADSYDLKDFGWKGHCGNIPSSYLAGFLLGKRALEEGIEEMIFDIGLQTSVAGSRIYASIKGVLDSGINIPVGEKVLPDEERIRGKHIEHIAKNMDEKDKEKQFSRMIDVGLDPEKISEEFEKVKENIIEEYGE